MSRPFLTASGLAFREPRDKQLGTDAIGSSVIGVHLVEARAGEGEGEGGFVRTFDFIVGCGGRMERLKEAVTYKGPGGRRWVGGKWQVEPRGVSQLAWFWGEEMGRRIVVSASLSHLSLSCAN
tara:strand:+ start:7904 stop:8272 length:369 start_codon:yes stop_codon:yes gene_type:complete